MSIVNNTGKSLLIGSNNAYGWYALIDSDGALIDWGTDATIGQTMPEFVKSLIDDATDFDLWQGVWDDGDGARWAEDVDITDGEDAALTVFGGDIDARITCDDDAETWIDEVENDH